MQKKDKVTDVYMKDEERVADLINAFAYQGKEVLKKEQIRERKQVYYGKADKAKEYLWGIVRDIVIEAEVGAVLILLGIENQSGIHYAMPLRVLKDDAANYDDQYRKIRNEHKKAGDLKPREYISGFAKDDILVPVITVCLYWGEEPWDGPRNLKDMLDLEGLPEEIKGLLADYPMNLIEVNNFEHPEYFKTDLRLVFEFLQNRNDKNAMKKYVEEHTEELEWIAEDTFDVLCEMANTEGLSALKEVNKNEEGAVGMCKAFDDWREELLQEGHELGWEAGRSEGLELGRSEGLELGRSEGGFLTKIKLVRVNLKKNFSVKMLAEFLEEKQENIELICESLHANPDMNDEEVFGLIKEQWAYGCF